MTNLRVVTSSGGEAMLENAAVQKFADTLRGRLIRPGDGGYDEARRVWNGMIDRRPALVARCAGPADVVAAVRFARAHELLVSVKGGGHNITGNAVCEGGLMIDLSPMKGVRVDPAARTARAEAGLTWGEYNRETQAFGLASTGGVVSTTGIAGLTLGGGLGWLMGKHGLSCDNLLSADLVTADGELLTVSADRHPELYWGLRGGGGNFGVVTSFEYRLHPVGSVLAGMVLHPLAKAAQVLRFYREYARACPDELTAFAALMTSPEGDPVVALVAGHIGDHAAGEKLLAPLRKFGAPLVDTIAPTSYVALNLMFDAAFPYGGVQRYWKSSFLKELGDDALDILVDRANRMRSPMSMIGFFHVHGAAARVDPDATAFGLRDDQWDYDVISQWNDPAEAADHVAWTREVWNAVEPFASGKVYVNHLDAEEGARIGAAYSDNYGRLIALKNKYDPSNLFRMNQNIRPTV
ncbi:MAG TPA: FAD-binding oxidoreductase [Stellaceae bacterium]|nr:FAD-binding oxidoreductase [Stellaceae bacterium]